MKYYIYRCVGDERWDMLAWLYYGDAGAIAPIIEANKHVPIDVILPKGVYIRVPVLEDQQEEIISNSVPPWRR